MHTVIAIYPNLEIKARVTKYDVPQEAYDYINHGLELCRTPYILLQDEQVEKIQSFDLSMGQMAEIINEYL